MAAGNVAAAVVAVSSTLDSPSPQPSPSQPDPAAKAPSLPAPKPSTPAISMTAALKNVGAVSIYIYKVYHTLNLILFGYVFLSQINFAFCVWQITPLKESLPEPETATVIQVSV